MVETKSLPLTPNNDSTLTNSHKRKKVLPQSFLSLYCMFSTLYVYVGGMYASVHLCWVLWRDFQDHPGKKNLIVEPLTTTATEQIYQ